MYENTAKKYSYEIANFFFSKKICNLIEAMKYKYK